MTRIPSETLEVYVCNACDTVRVESAVEGNPSCCDKDMNNIGWIEESTLRNEGEEKKTAKKTDETGN